MGEVVPARTSPTLHPLSPPTVHQLSWLALQELIVVCMYDAHTCLNPSSLHLSHAHQKNLCTVAEQAIHMWMDAGSSPISVH